MRFILEERGREGEVGEGEIKEDEREGRCSDQVLQCKQHNSPRKLS